MKVFDNSKHYIRAICKAGHDWQNLNQSLRWKSNRNCVECCKINANQQRAKNPEKFKQRQKEYYQSSEGQEYRKKYLQTEARKASQQKYNASSKGKLAKERWDKSEKGKEYHSSDIYKECKRNKDKKYMQTDRGKDSRLLAQKRYRHKNRIVLSSKTKLYRQTIRGKEVHRAIQSRRRVRKKKNHVGIYTPQDIQFLREHFNNLCAYCGENLGLHIDHFIPIYLGGPDALGNIVPCCIKCNSSKNNHSPDEWFKAQKFYSKKAWTRILSALGKTESTLWQLPLI